MAHAQAVPHCRLRANKLLLPLSSSGTSSSSSSGAKAPDDVAKVKFPLRVRELPQRNRQGCNVKPTRDETLDPADVELECLTEAALSPGNAEAQFDLGKLYLNGHLVPQDSERALHLFELAASAENSSAQFALGFMHDLRLGIDTDDARAVHWYQMAANQGHAAAMFGLAMMLSNGRGRPRNDQDAFKWFMSAAELGDLEAQCEVGERLMRGKGSPKDFDGARHWLLKAAQGGSPDAQNSLGIMAARGLGHEDRNDQEALRWFSLAAAHYHAPSMKNLGDMYARGRGVRCDDEEAARWYRLAVQEGADHAPALKALGDMYSSGRGVHKNLREALRLYGMAAEIRKVQIVEAVHAADDSPDANEVAVQVQAESEKTNETDDDKGREAIFSVFTARAFALMVMTVACQLLVVMTLACQCQSRKMAVRRLSVGRRR